MSLPTDLLFTIAFDQTNTPPNFQLEDTTDYSTLAIALADVRGNFTVVTDPLGNTIHNNTDYSAPDITASSSLLYTGINVPTDVNGGIVSGQYSFTYVIKTDSPITALNQGTPSFTIAGDYTAELALATSIIVVRSTLNNGTYTIVSAVLSGTDTIITVAEAIPSGTADGSIQYATQPSFSKTLTTTYVDTVPVVEIGVEADCFCGSLVSTDETNYGLATIISRTHTVKYPAALQVADVVSSNATITITPIYTKTWTTIIQSEISIPITGGSIIAIITGSEETVVDCDLSLCDISCCVVALNNRYLDNRTANPSEAAKDFARLTRMMQLIEIFTMAYKCDQHAEAAAALTEIKTVGNCTDACSCGDDEPTLVVPLCGAGNGSFIQVTAGTGVVVNTTMSNGNYVYQVGISPSVMAMINASTPISLSASTGISVSSAIVAGVTVWTITNTSPYVEQNRLEFICQLQYAAPNAVTITNSAYLASGSNIVGTATVTALTIATAAQNNQFRVTAFQVAGNTNYKVTGQLIIVTRAALGAYTNNSTRTIDVEFFYVTTGQFDFRIIGNTGFALSNTALSAFSDIKVHIKISQ